MSVLPDVHVQRITKPPLMPGIPILGSALDLMRDPPAFFVRGYHELGSVYSVRAPTRDLYVLAGRQANLFMTQKGDGVLHTYELFGDFSREMQSEIFLVAMDGSEHCHLRGEMRDGYARKAYMRYLPDFFPNRTNLRLTVMLRRAANIVKRAYLCRTGSARIPVSARAWQKSL